MSPETARYLKRNVERFKAAVPPADWIELDPFAGNDNPVIRAYIETAMGRTTHRSRSRIKSALYNWKRIDAWMTEHGMSNTSLAFLLDCSSGTIANIRSGHYTGKPMIDRVENLIAQCERG
jgi:hypothetical protein